MGIGQRNIIIIIILIKKNFFGNFSACFVDVFVIIPGLLSQLLFSTSLIYYAENVSSRASVAQRNSVQSHMHQLQYIQRVLVWSICDRLYTKVLSVSPGVLFRSVGSHSFEFSFGWSSWKIQRKRKGGENGQESWSLPVCERRLFHAKWRVHDSIAFTVCQSKSCWLSLVASFDPAAPWQLDFSLFLLLLLFFLGYRYT